MTKRPRKRFPADLKAALPPVAWNMTSFDVADAAAVRGVATGTATPEQQRRAFAWIVEECCAYYQLSFHPDHPRWQDFAEGKRFVGQQMVTLANFRPPPDPAAPTEQPP